jgi:hypothetical protein
MTKEKQWASHPAVKMASNKFKAMLRRWPDADKTREPEFVAAWLEGWAWGKFNMGWEDFLASKENKQWLSSDLNPQNGSLSQGEW